MKSNKSFFSSLLVLAVIMMSFTFGPEGEKGDEATTNSEVVMDDGNDHCCCPPGWVLATYSPATDPASAWDNNGDGFVCAKNLVNTGHPSDGTPKGKGNYQDPEGTQLNINVKDNNQPCAEGAFNPCAN